MRGPFPLEIAHPGLITFSTWLVISPAQVAVFTRVIQKPTLVVVIAVPWLAARSGTRLRAASIGLVIGSLIGFRTHLLMMRAASPRCNRNHPATTLQNPRVPPPAAVEQAPPTPAERVRVSQASILDRYPAPGDEEHRLAALARFDIANQSLQRELEGLARLAQHITTTPYAMVNIVSRDQQITVCAVGIEVPSVPRVYSLCNDTVIKHDLLYIPDLLNDEQFHNHPIISSALGVVRMYAGAPLLTDDGQALGALCVADVEPHELDEHQREALRDLADQVVTVLELQRHAALLSRAYADLEDFIGLVVRDLRHPLTQATEQTEALADLLVVGSPLTGEALRGLHSSLLGTQEVVQEVLEATGLPTTAARMQMHDLNQIADQAVDQVQRNQPSNPTRVFITRLPTVQVDQELMVQVFRTLVTNAMVSVVATSNPMVQISARESGRGWVIIVDDSGSKSPGSESGAATRFGDQTPHSGEDATHTAVQAATSTGQTTLPAPPPISTVPHPNGHTYEPKLGLATCRRIVERHHGHLWFEDSELGGGRVCLYLPTTQHNDHEHSPSA